MIRKRKLFRKLRFYLTGIIIFISSQTFYGSTSHEFLIKKQIDIYLAKGDSCFNIRRLDDAREYYEKAGEVAEKEGLEYDKYYSVFKVGYSYLAEDEKFLALAYFTEIDISFLPQNRQDSSFLFLMQLEIDVITFKPVRSEYDTELLEKKVKYFSSFLKAEDRYKVKFLVGKIFYGRLEYSNALNNYNQIVNLEIKDTYLRENIIYSIALCYRAQQELIKASDNFQILDNTSLLYVDRFRVKQGMGNNYMDLKDYKKAKDCYISLLMQENYTDWAKDKISFWYVSLARAYIGLADNESAERNFYLAEQNANTANKRLFVYSQTIKFYYRNEMYEQCPEYVRKGFELLENNNVSFYRISSFYFNVNHFYWYSQQLDKVMEMSRQYDSIRKLNSVAYVSINLKKLQMNYDILAALALREFWARDSLDVNLLNESYRRFKVIFATAEEIFGQAVFEKSQLEATEYMRIAYENLFLVAHNLYVATGEARYLEEVYDYLEGGKALLFRSMVSGAEALHQSKIPENLLKKESELKKQINRLEYFLYNNQDNQLSSQEKAKLYRKLSEIKLTYDFLIRSLEQNYVLYKENKNVRKSFAIKEVQNKLEDDQVLIDYFTSEGRFFIMAITPDNSCLVETKVGSDFKKRIINYRSLIENYNPYSNTKEQFKELIHTSYELYNKLILPIEKSIKNRRLLIVPDRELNLIPFETLVSDTNFLVSNHSAIPYLIKRNSISILYSVQQLDMPSGELSQKSRFVGFGPDYSGYSDKNISVLPAAQEEIVEIEKYFRGKSYLNENATKSNFLQESANYDLVHLAMHTRIYENNPAYSQLLFTCVDDSLERVMSTYEIYGMRFNALLMVLSGCNTGSGELKYGEGLMNIARSFFYSGISNIIVTQWEVSDKSSADLLNCFYAHLTQGNSVDVALQQAKIDYLTTADPVRQHPYYWAGYVTVGKPVVYNKSRVPLVIYFLVGALLFLPITQYFKAKLRGN